MLTSALETNNLAPSSPSIATVLGINNKKLSGGSGFNYEIEKRVHERVSDLMNVPVTMLGLVEQYSKTDVFEPPFLRPHQKDDFFRFLWSVWKEFNADLYYGQEDGLMFGIVKGSGTYQEGRGSNGYRIGENNFEGNSTILSEEDAYMKQLYYEKCMDRKNGAAQNCTLQPMEEYVGCINNCKLSPCPSTKASINKQKMYCPTYEFTQAPEDDVMGYIPRYYYCLNNAGTFIENDPPNSVATPDAMKNGVCAYSDGVTLVEGKLASKQTYAMSDRRNYMFLRDYDYPSEEEGDAAAKLLYADDPIEIDDSQKSDQIFVGGHHSRRYEPRARPWYKGVRQIQDAYWTKPYPFATNNDMGISYAKPLYYTDPSTGHNVFRGVLSVDYDLDAISRFLREVFMEILESKEIEELKEDETSMEEVYSRSVGATILIVEDDAPHYIIGTSSGSAATKQVRIDDESVTCSDNENFAAHFDCKTVRSTPEDFTQTSIALDEVMALAFEAQKEVGFPKRLVVSLAPTSSNNDTAIADYYVSQSVLYEQSGGANLRWRIIVAMPVSVASNDAIVYGNAMFVVVMAVGVLGCLSCVVLFYYYFTKRKKTEVRMSDWRFTSAFILGCALLNLTTLTYIGQITDQTCILRMWAFHICFVLALAPLLIKVWRIYKLVGSADRVVRLSITNQKALLYTMPPIVLQIIILAIFSIFDPAKSHTYVDIQGSSSFQHTVCKHKTTAFTITEVLFEGCLVLAGCILAFKTRNLGSTLGEAKQLLCAMYNVALVGVIVLLMGSFLYVDQVSVFVIRAVGTFWATAFSSCAFVLPRILQLQRNNLRRNNSRASGFMSNSFKRSGSFYNSFDRTRSLQNVQLSNHDAISNSLHNEPRSQLPVSSIQLSDCNSSYAEAQQEAPHIPKISFTSDSHSLGSDVDVTIHDSEAEESLPLGKEQQKDRSTSFTKLSISPSESDALQRLGESTGSSDSCNIRRDIEENIVSENHDLKGEDSSKSFE